MDELQEPLSRSPELFPHLLDLRTDSVSFIRLRKIDYERASFLDERVLTSQSLVRALAWPQVVAAIDAAQLTERCHFIFHIGHVGSTLLSRLIGAHPAVFALREPMILRTLALIDSELDSRPEVWRDGDFGARLSGSLKLLSRTFDARQIALVKATSFVGEMAASLLSRASTPKAILMYVSPERYLATILGGPNSRQEAKLLAPSRLRRLHRRIGAEVWRLASLSEGEVIALSWACETAALAEAARVAGDRACRIDFDEFLAAPSTQLESVFRELEVTATAGEVQAILAGPDMRRYSKAPEYAYDAALRLDVLNAARAAHGIEIRRGLAWVDRAAAQFAAVRHAMALAA